MHDKAKDGKLRSVNGAGPVPSAADDQPKKRRRWDQTTDADTPTSSAGGGGGKKGAGWDAGGGGEGTTPSISRWDETPGRQQKGGETPGATPGMSTRVWDTTPGHAATPGAVTPGRETPGTASATPSASARKNRWDETPKTERGEGRGEGGGGH